MKKRLIASVILIAMVCSVVLIISGHKTEEEVSTEPETMLTIETETQKETVKEETVVNVAVEETEPASTEEDLSYLVTSKQYTLGYGVRARLSPDENGTIFKVFYDIYSPVDVIEEGPEWYKCLVDNKIVYIAWKYIGDENAVEYVKEKRAREEKMKSSAYYEVFKNMTNEDYDLLARILALEAGDQPWLGKLAVIEVVMNRMISKNPGWHKSSVTACLRQSGQFTTIKYLSHPYKLPTDNDYAAIEYVRENGPTAIRKILDDNGMTNINSLDYVFFATYRANGRDFVKYGDHYFSRETNSSYWRKPCN